MRYVVLVCLLYLELIEAALNTTGSFSQNTTTNFTEVQPTTYRTDVTSQYYESTTATPSTNAVTSNPEISTPNTPITTPKPTIDSLTTYNTTYSSEVLSSSGSTSIYRTTLTEPTLNTILNLTERNTLPNSSKDNSISTTTQSNVTQFEEFISAVTTDTIQNRQTKTVRGNSTIAPPITTEELATTTETTGKVAATTPVTEEATSVYESVSTGILSVTTRANAVISSEVTNSRTSDLHTSTTPTSTTAVEQGSTASQTSLVCTCPSSVPTLSRNAAAFDPASFIIGFIIPTVALVALAIKFYLYRQKAKSQVSKMSEQPAYLSFDVIGDKASTTSPTIPDSEDSPVLLDITRVGRNTRPMSMIVNRPKSVFTARPKSMYEDSTMSHHEKGTTIPMTSFLT